MKFPAGTPGGKVSDPQDEQFMQDMMAFCGAIEITTATGNGLIITDNGRLISAYFHGNDEIFRGKDALSRLSRDPGGNDTPQSFSLHHYSPDELAQAVRISQEENLILSSLAPSSSAAGMPQGISHESSMVLLDESKLKKILAQPGVIAVSAFFEGFPVQSIGDADFEHVAASAEDFARAGTRIAQEMNIGNLDQLILETPSNKFIIAPCGDLHLCIFTRADAQLGLIRVVLRSIQKEING